MPKLMLDNSAISILNCARKYQLICIEGRRPPSSDEQLYGSAQHVALELFDRGHKSIETVLPVLGERFGPKSLTKVTAVTSTFRSQAKLPPPITIADRPAVEVKFSWPYTTIRDYEIHLCGTIDKIYLDEASDILVFADYKTSAAGTPYAMAKAQGEYQTAFQLPFYVYNLKNCPDLLPAHYKEYIRDNRYRIEIWLLFHNASPIKCVPVSHGPFPVDFIDREIESIIRHRAEDAVRIAELTSPAPHTGFTVYKACENCAFRPGCLSVGSEREIEYISRFDQVPYDPMSFR